MSDDKGVEIHYPVDTVTVLLCFYVHKVGFSVRSVGVPGASPTAYLDRLEQAGLRCSHSLPLVYVFTGYWPGKNKTFQYVTGSPHEASSVINNPKMMRIVGTQMQSRLIPLDPVTGSGILSVGEHNDWLDSLLNGNEQSDWSMIDDMGTGTSSVEDFLRQITETEEK